MLDLVDPIEDSIRTSTGSEDAGEVAAQRSTDSPGIVDKGAGEELDHGRRHGLGQIRPNGPANGMVGRPRPDSGMVGCPRPDSGKVGRA